MTFESTSDSLGLGIYKADVLPAFVKSAKVSHCKSSYKITDFTFADVLNNGTKLINFSVEEDEKKKVYLLAEFQSPIFLAYGKYVDGKHKGTVSVKASK
jgi:hypothetical protein